MHYRSLIFKLKSQDVFLKISILTFYNFTIKLTRISSFIDIPGVFPACQMKCDLEPCKNGGICTEDFRKQESSCNCEHTSYFGEFCMEEKGADFSGESVLQRKFILDNEVDSVKIQLAFSSSDLRQKSNVMLLLQTVNSRSYYLLVALTAEGYLQFEEDREGSVFGAKVSRNFLNGNLIKNYYSSND